MNYMTIPGIKSKTRKALNREMNLYKEATTKGKREKIYNDLVISTKKNVSRLAGIISQYFKEDIFIKTRERETLVKRQIAHYFAVELELGFYHCIASEMGDVDHATIYNSVKVVQNLIDLNISIMGALYKIEERTKKNPKKLITITRFFNGSDRFEDLIKDLRAYIKLKFNQNPQHEA